MLVYSSNEGDLVLDPFMGSGQTAFVAKDLKRNYIGSEIVEEYCRFANKRVDSGQYLIPNIIIPDIDIPKEELTWLKKLTKKLTKSKAIKDEKNLKSKSSHSVVKEKQINFKVN